jgi:hypothetical protein
MSVSLHGLLELLSSSFPRCDHSSIPGTWSIMTCFITLCRGVLLFPQTRLAMLHNRVIIPVHTTLRMGPSTKDSPITGFIYSVIYPFALNRFTTAIIWHLYWDTRAVILSHKMGTLRASTRWSSSREHSLTKLSKDIRNKEGLADLSIPFQNL